MKKGLAAAWKNKDPIAILITIVIVVLVFRWASNWIPEKLKEMRRASTMGKDGENNATNDSGKTVDKNTVARSFRSGMNPSGYPGLFHVDGTDENTIYQAATDSAGIFSDVSRVYSDLYKGDSLLGDLTGELDGEELARVRQLARLSGYYRRLQLVRIG